SGPPLRYQGANGRFGVLQLVREPHAAGSVQKKGKRDRGAFVPLEHVDVDGDAFDVDAKVLFLEVVDESAFLVENLRGQQHIFRSGALRIGWNGRRRRCWAWQLGANLLPSGES